MPFPGYPLDATRSNETAMSDRHPLDHNEEREALNDLQAQIDAINANIGNFVPNSIFQVKGDTLAATAANTPVRMAVPGNYGILVSDSAEGDGWRAVGNAFRVEGGPAWTITPNIPLAFFEVSRTPLPVGASRTGQVALTIALTNSTGVTLTNGQVIGTLASGYRPTNTFRAPGYNVSTGINNCMFNVQSSGAVFISVGGGWVAPTTTQSFGFSIAYSTNDA